MCLMPFQGTETLNGNVSVRRVYRFAQSEKKQNKIQIAHKTTITSKQKNGASC